ncbi:MAG TPA: hypothetical protein VGK30_07660, partial [Candidatus Binatia bacterium]
MKTEDRRRSLRPRQLAGASSGISAAVVLMLAAAMLLGGALLDGRTTSAGGPQPSLTPTPTATDSGTPTPAGTAQAVPLDHFSCYESHGGTAPRITVTLDDVFGPGTVAVGAPKRLCAPADKNTENPAAAMDPDHLVGYRIVQRSPRFERLRNVTVTDQFGPHTLDLLRPDFIFVPSAKGV